MKLAFGHSWRIGIAVIWTTFGAGPATAEPPRNLQGVWAMADSVLRDGALWGGMALYLSARGDGVLVMAPLPVGECGGAVCAPRIGMPVQVTATPDARRFAMRAGAGREVQHLALEYDPVADRLVLFQAGSAGAVQMGRHARELPAEMDAELGRLRQGTGGRGEPPRSSPGPSESPSR